MNGPNKTLRAVVLGLGYFFLYVPIISLMVFSFNESPAVTSWTGFSFRWYHSLFNDDALLRAAWLSFRIAAMTAPTRPASSTAPSARRASRMKR